ncbi:MAG: hypothetical protein N2691_02050 [Patescibacteria group bacterium]|nr:hypothetical protein [Patescibacteria group bacterium]
MVRIRDFQVWAVEKIFSLRLRQFREKPPSFACAIVLRDKFLEFTKIPASYTWALSCSRGLRRAGREDTVVISSAYANLLDFNPNDPLDKLSEQQVDILRESIHEHLPTLRDHYLPYPSAKLLPISEAMDEIIPRYVLGLQEHMPGSTRFLVAIPDERLLTVRDLWIGFSRIASDPVSRNVAYGSAFLLGLGLIRQIEKLFRVCPESAVSMWLDTMCKAETPVSCVANLASLAEIEESGIWYERSLQRSGQQFLSQTH